MKIDSEKIRIVIPTYNAKETICECVQSIYNSVLYFDHWEIIVVDNGNNINLKKTLQNYPVKIIIRKEKSSAAYARNEGAKGFKEGILVFIDSDVIIEKNCLKKLTEPILTKKCDVTIGNYSQNIQGLTFAQKYKQLYINYIYSRKQQQIKNEFWTAISALNANVFHKLNGFNQNFNKKNSEDTEFGIRLSQNGFQVVAVNEAFGIHKHLYTIKKIIINDFRKGVSALVLSNKKKVPITDNRHANRKDILAVFTATMTIFLLLSSFIFYQLILGSIFVFVLWIILRFKLISIYYNTRKFNFYMKAIILMFILDLVRTTCVLFSFIQIKIFKNYMLDYLPDDKY